MESPIRPETADALPKLARWLGLNRINNAAAGRALGVSGEAVRKWCLPFTDSGRQVPGLAQMERIVQWTGGAVVPADFYPPRLNGFADAAAQPEAAQ